MAALAQIEAQRYADSLLAEGHCAVLRYGVAFCGKRCMVKKKE